MDAWINEPEPEEEQSDKKDSGGLLEIFYKSTGAVPEFRDGYQAETGTGYDDEGEEAHLQRREARRVIHANNPHYLKGSSSSSSRRSPSSLLSPSASEDVSASSVNPSNSQKTGGKLSDKYLELERNKESESQSKKHRSKKDKKKKKSKGKGM